MNPNQIQAQSTSDQTSNPINRAIWLRQWKLVPFRLYNFLWTLLPRAVIHILNQFSTRIEDNLFCTAMMITGFGIWAIGFGYFFAKEMKLREYNMPQIVSKKTQLLLLVIGTIPAVILGFGSFERILDFSLLSMVALQFVFTWLELRSLQQKLMQTSPNDHIDSTSTLGISRAHQRLIEPKVSNQAATGNSIKQPASRLFVRAKLV